MGGSAKATTRLPIPAVNVSSVISIARTVPPLGETSGEPVPNQVPTPPDSARQYQASPDVKAALISGNRTQRDAVRRNRHAWHAEGRGVNLGQVSSSWQQPLHADISPCNGRPGRPAVGSWHEQPILDAPRRDGGDRDRRPRREAGIRCSHQPGRGGTAAAGRDAAARDHLRARRGR